MPEPREHRTAPKGRLRPAQGNALGLIQCGTLRALKGRNTPMPPFQGLPSFRPPNPRALPWAVLLCPFRAKGEPARGRCRPSTQRRSSPPKVSCTRSRRAQMNRCNGRASLQRPQWEGEAPAEPHTRIARLSNGGSAGASPSHRLRSNQSIAHSTSLPNPAGH